MEGSTVTDSSLLPISMPVPLQTPVAVKGTESSGQTLTFADLFSRIMSAETTLASGELAPSAEVAPQVSLLPETTSLLAQPQAAPAELATLPSLLTPEGGQAPLAQGLPDVATATAPGEAVQAQAQVAEPSALPDSLPALISRILSEQQTPAGKPLSLTEPSLAEGGAGDDLTLRSGTPMPVTPFQKPLLQDGLPIAAATQGEPEADTLPYMPEPSRIAPPVQIAEGTVEIEQGLGRATAPALPEVPLQGRPADAAVAAAASVPDRAVTASESLSAPTSVEKPVVVKHQLDPAGPGQLGDRIMVMINRDLQQAQIRMDPPELGHLKIALAVDGDQVSVQFTASQPGLRELIIQQTDRLRQHLESQQLNLVSVDVTTDQGRDPRHPAQEYGPDASVPLFSADVSGDEGGLPVTMQQYSTGLLDVFA
ncbi:flagellar hook-length control protein FliK [Kistimonas asteriae]|uniref:flagellar hook-length control protein FliK n=1 Tax=Kistimonas asteriae TaxID=517724 RepID=UPI001BA923FF|nr:flagellar hook-length control protein FliK [Kistimonas asteriae]